jgi:hypothetical protein
LSVAGSDTNINAVFGSKGTGNFQFSTNNGAQEQVRITHTASAVNFVQVTGAATTAVPSIIAAGSDANVALSIRGQGTGYLNLMNNQANYFQVYSAAAGSHPTMYAWGSDTNVNYNIASKGAGSVVLRTNDGSNTQAIIAHTANAVNYVQLTGGATGVAPTISAQGADTNISLQLNAKGTGGVRTQFYHQIGTGSPNFITISGSGANVAPYIQAQGSDTNIDLSITTKGTGAMNVSTGNGVQFRVIDSGATTANWVETRGGVSGGSSLIQTWSTGGTAPLALSTRGTADFTFSTNANSFQQFKVAATANTVNFIQVTGAATGGRPTISAQGSDTNIDVSITPKGTGFANITSGGIKFPDATIQTTAASAALNVTLQQSFGGF